LTFHPIIAIFSSKKCLLKKGGSMNKYYLLCCAFLSLQVTHQINGAEQQKDKWDATKYKQNSSPQDHFAQYALGQLAFEENDSVIDLGCGNGKNTYIVAEKTKGLVVGVDSSHDMIKQAQSDYQKGNLHYCLGDMVSFKSNQKVNKVTALCSISWVPEQEKVYKNIATLLLSGGSFVGLVNDQNGPVVRAYQQAFGLLKWQEYFKKYKPSFYPSDKESVRTWLEEAGFHTITVKEAEIPKMTMQPNDFTKALMATPGVKDAIPAELYQNFIEDVVEQYLTIVPQDDTGKIQINSGLLLVLAQKH
jgi:trans-aconitate 2-methyltransferase